MINLIEEGLALMKASTEFHREEVEPLPTYCDEEPYNPLDYYREMSRQVDD